MQHRAASLGSRLIPFPRDYGIFGTTTIRRGVGAGEAMRAGVGGGRQPGGAHAPVSGRSAPASAAVAARAVVAAARVGRRRGRGRGRCRATHRGAGERLVSHWWPGGVLAPRQGGSGQPARLSVEPQERVGDEVATGRFRTAAEIGAWIAETFGVAYRPGGVASLLGRLRCHPKVPRPLHEQADPQAQTAWKGGASPRRSRRPASPATG